MRKGNSRVEIVLNRRYQVWINLVKNREEAFSDSFAKKEEETIGIA